MNNEQKEIMTKMVDHISEVMSLMNNFESSREGSIAFTKLEEALMWLTVVTNNIALKTPIAA